MSRPHRPYLTSCSRATRWGQITHCGGRTWPLVPTVPTYTSARAYKTMPSSVGICVAHPDRPQLDGTRRDTSTPAQSLSYPNRAVGTTVPTRRDSNQSFLCKHPHVSLPGRAPLVHSPGVPCRGLSQPRGWPVARGNGIGGQLSPRLSRPVLGPPHAKQWALNNIHCHPTLTYIVVQVTENRYGAPGNRGRRENAPAIRQPEIHWSCAKLTKPRSKALSEDVISQLHDLAFCNRISFAARDVFAAAVGAARHGDGRSAARELAKLDLCVALLVRHHDRS